MPDWLHDLRYGLRMIAKRPGTSAIAVVALALGIGLTTTMFSIIQGVILRGLPFPESDRIISVVRSPVKAPGRETPPLHDFVDWRERQKVFESLAGYTEIPATIATDTGFPERRRAARMTPNTLSVLRVAPIVGRDFTDADALPGAPPVVLIGHRVWESLFKSDPNVSGTTIRVASSTVNAPPVSSRDAGAGMIGGSSERSARACIDPAPKSSQTISVCAPNFTFNS